MRLSAQAPCHITSFAVTPLTLRFVCASPCPVQKKKMKMKNSYQYPRTWTSPPATSRIIMLQNHEYRRGRRDTTLRPSPSPQWTISKKNAIAGTRSLSVTWLLLLGPRAGLEEAKK
ncbi:hypothetical protein BGZ63DRAFT_371303 [Mariannaea sp. PMI_226]|nr:hypothetical protein BGZ63DRAFT_371303 [Mariannaea sp. PMI_226]